MDNEIFKKTLMIQKKSFHSVLSKFYIFGNFLQKRKLIVHLKSQIEMK